MDRGLWRYSRHPNYFFQTLTWVAYALIAVAAPWGWLAFLAPALILYLVLFVTGVPPAEESSLRSPRRGLPPIPGADVGLRAMAADALVDRLIASGRVPDPLLRAGIRAACATPAAPRAPPRLRGEGGVRRAAARLADRRAGREAERAALRGAAGVLPARARAAPQVQLLPLARGSRTRSARPRTRCSR